MTKVFSISYIFSDSKFGDGINIFQIIMGDLRNVRLERFTNPEVYYDSMPSYFNCSSDVISVVHDKV